MRRNTTTRHLDKSWVLLQSFVAGGPKHGRAWNLEFTSSAVYAPQRAPFANGTFLVAIV